MLEVMSIYSFKEVKPIVTICEQLLAGVVTETKSGIPLDNTKVQLLDSSFKLISEKYSDADGKFNFGKQIVDEILYKN